MKRLSAKLLLVLSLSFIFTSCKKESLPETAAWHDAQTISFGAETGRSSSDNMAMGNPSGAVADAYYYWNYLMVKTQYSMSYHRDRGTPNWVSWHLDPTWLGTTARQDDFRSDATLPTGW